MREDWDKIGFPVVLCVTGYEVGMPESGGLPPTYTSVEIWLKKIGFEVYSPASTPNTPFVIRYKQQEGL